LGLNRSRFLNNNLAMVVIFFLLVCVQATLNSYSDLSSTNRVLSDTEVNSFRESFYQTLAGSWSVSGESNGVFTC